MKKCMVVRAPVAALKEAKKVARQLKKAHEKVWGEGTCEVVVVPDTMEVSTVCEGSDLSFAANLACGSAGCCAK